MNEFFCKSTQLVCLLGLTLLAACQPQKPTPSPTDYPPSSPPGRVLFALPDAIDPDGRYLFYIHGRIIEDEGVDPVSPQFGRYAFTDILNYFAQAGFITIGEVRSGPTDVDAYAGRVVTQVESLLAAGVPAEQITLVGFSKGAYITMLVSSKVKNPELKFVLIAICGKDTLSNPDIALTGVILSLYESSDEYGSSCQSLLERSPGVVGYEEIAFETDKQHGAFYTADPLWLDPILAWIEAIP